MLNSCVCRPLAGQPCERGAAGPSGAAAGAAGAGCCGQCAAAGSHLHQAGAGPQHQVRMAHPRARLPATCLRTAITCRGELGPCATRLSRSQSTIGANSQRAEVLTRLQAGCAAGSSAGRAGPPSRWHEQLPHCRGDSGGTKPQSNVVIARGPDPVTACHVVSWKAPARWDGTRSSFVVCDLWSSTAGHGEILKSRHERSLSQHQQSQLPHAIPHQSCTLCCLAATLESNCRHERWLRGSWGAPSRRFSQSLGKNRWPPHRSLRLVRRRDLSYVCTADTVTYTSLEICGMVPTRKFPPFHARCSERGCGRRERMSP